MYRRLGDCLPLIAALIFVSGSTSEGFAAAFPKLQSLKVSVTTPGGTWAILERDGASRQVARYLSSLEWGETGTGSIVSPPFIINSDVISFTICGHDGQGGGKGKNYFALVDAKTGNTLFKTPAPGNDVMQQKSWDVEPLKGRKVYLEAKDGDSGSAFAWMGIGKLDAGANIKIDFSRGMPEDWTSTAPKPELQTEVVSGGIPFRRIRSAYSIIPSTESAKIKCEFKAERLFFLGCTVGRSQPTRIFGWIEIEYDDGPIDRIPLIYGYTLDGEGKLFEPLKSMYIHSSSDPFQHYMVVKPRNALIRSITLTANGDGAMIPRITAVTCQTDDSVDTLEPLPPAKIDEAEAAWINTHAISPSTKALLEIEPLIRKRHGMKAVRFRREKISDTLFEAASVCDVNRDGKKDIVSGAYWYEGPEFKTRRDVAEVKPAGEYLCDFSDYPMDVNRDGYPDIVTGDFFGQPLRWLENPRNSESSWKTHEIAQVGPIETTRFWDVDGDGNIEIVPNAGGNVVFFKLIAKSRNSASPAFKKYEVKLGGCGHGLGFGDVNGDSRGDFIVPNGWIEAPPNPLTEKWTYHADGLQFGAASVPILVHDVNGDKKADLIVGHAHGYGIDWFEQGVDDQGVRVWTKHVIDRYYSQYHDMALHDIDNDGELELITGKRYRAHNGHDPGSADDVFIRYFDIEDGRFFGHTIDVGPHDSTSGVGIYFWVEDLDNDGWKDLVCPGKTGLYVFKNLGLE